MKPYNERTALITGATGMDGSHLSEYLLGLGYKVVALRRRTSTFNTERLENVFNHPNFVMEWGNICDSSSLYKIINKYKPDEVYNLAAQSHVRVSFDVSEETIDVVGTGFLKLVNVCKELIPHARIYQASSSEMYGDNPEVPQNEETRMTPASPYAASKLFSHNIARNYREGYGMFICSGILFNHETVAADTPLIFHEGNENEIDIKPISEIVSNHTSKNESGIIDFNNRSYQDCVVNKPLYVWDKSGWTKVKFASGYPHDVKFDNKQPKLIGTKKSAIMATSSHGCIMENETEKEFGKIEFGDKISLVEVLPKPNKTIKNTITEKEAELVGFFVGDGSCNKNLRGLRITGKNKIALEYYQKIWESLGGKVKYSQSVSGFNSDEYCFQMNMSGNRDWVRKFLIDVYTENRDKRVPKYILNANSDIQRAFFKGYYAADGLKATKNTASYEYTSFVTNSATLALGLIFIVENVFKQDYNICVEKNEKWENGNLFYYRINLLSDSRYSFGKSKSKASEVIKGLTNGLSIKEMSRRKIASRGFIRKVSKGYKPSGIHHLSVQDNSVKKIVSINDYDGWFFDLETESGTFHCGPGRGHVHNSPRRGETFVTRKITQAAAKIKLGLQDKLYLGNLDAKRDWGYAPEYVKCMWLMLQQDKPDDFVIATGETHTVREFLEETFNLAGLDIDKHVVIDNRLFRPHEVPVLLGDPSKAKKVLNWEPKVKFKDLVKIMYEADLAAIAKENNIQL